MGIKSPALVAAALVAAAVLASGCGAATALSGSVAQSSPLAQAAQTHAPSASVSSWFKAYGNPAYTQIVDTDLDPVMGDPVNGYTWTAANGSTVEADVAKALRDPPVPDASLNRQWVAALNATAAACQAQSTNQWSAAMQLMATIYDKLLLAR